MCTVYVASYSVLQQQQNGRIAYTSGWLVSWLAVYSVIDRNQCALTQAECGVYTDTGRDTDKDTDYTDDTGRI